MEYDRMGWNGMGWRDGERERKAGGGGALKSTGKMGRRGRGGGGDSIQDEASGGIIMFFIRCRKTAVQLLVARKQPLGKEARGLP